jgi:acetolactate synthase regulatory subunit
MSVRLTRRIEDSMVTVLESKVTAALRRAAIRGTRAPSIHNTQPWRFELQHGHLDIVADRSRQLEILDPTGRQLTISIGCALFNARVSLAATQVNPVIARLPEAGRPEVVARVSVGALNLATPDPIAAYDSMIEQRQTNRRHFVDERVPSDVIDELVEAAGAEDALLHHVRTEDDRLALARLAQHADEVQLLNPAYRAELRAWTSDDPSRSDGVPASVVPHVDGSAQDEIPIRDFDTSGQGWLPGATHSSRNQCLLLLGTYRDDALGWLRAGEALERVLLHITRRGFVASPLTQVIEVAPARAALRSELGLQWWPHVLLRVGRAPLTATTRRRRLSEVIFERL